MIFEGGHTKGKETCTILSITSTANISFIQSMKMRFCIPRLYTFVLYIKYSLTTATRSYITPLKFNLEQQFLFQNLEGGGEDAVPTRSRATSTPTQARAPGIQIPTTEEETAEGQSIIFSSFLFISNGSQLCSNIHHPHTAVQSIHDLGRRS